MALAFAAIMRSATIGTASGMVVSPAVRIGILGEAFEPMSYFATGVVSLAIITIVAMCCALKRKESIFRAK